MTSVERILEYGCVEPEGPLVMESAAGSQGGPLGNRIQYWQQSGKDRGTEEEEEGAEEPGMIELYGVSLRYSPGEKYVLKGLSFKIQRREKVITPSLELLFMPIHHQTTLASTDLFFRSVW